MKIKNRQPRVSIVGAGPGDIDLITVKGLKAIQSADVILYDALVDESLLQEAPESVMKIFVGKRAGLPCKKQEEINDLIVKHAFEFGHVVRLKGGDPFVFGRGHEELEYVRQFNIETTVIPGISSVTSTPLLQGVPVTRRGLSESFWVLTGSTKNHTLSNDIRLAAKSSATLVIVMGMRKLQQIVDILQNENKNDLPFMIIQSGSTKNEKVVLGTVGTILAKATAEKIGTPGIMIIGKVVSTHPDYIKQFETILVESHG